MWISLIALPDSNSFAPHFAHGMFFKHHLAYFLLQTHTLASENASLLGLPCIHAHGLIGILENRIKRPRSDLTEAALHKQSLILYYDETGEYMDEGDDCVLDGSSLHGQT